MPPGPEATIDIVAKHSKFQRAVSAVRRTLEKLKAKMIAVSNTAKFMLLAHVGAVYATVKAMTVQEDAERKLAAVLKATGHAAGFTAGQLKEMAGEMQKVTRFGDEVILNAQAILATFKNIRGDEFRLATEAMLDMATVLDTDLKGAAIQLGKALNDPIKGVAALADAGVSFTEAQKEMIRKFVEMGDIASAQAVILDELKGEFGGTARAMADGMGGALSQIKNLFGDLFEVIGAGIATVLQPLIEWVTPMVAKLQEWGEQHKRLIGLVAGGTATLLALGAVIGPLVSIFGTLIVPIKLVIGALPVLGAVIGAIASPVGIAVAAIGLLVAPLVLVAAKAGVFANVWEKVKSIVTSAISKIVDSVLWMVAFTKAAIGNWKDFMRASILAFAFGVVKAFEDLKYWLTETLPAYLAWFGRNWKQVFTDMGNLVATIFVNMWENVKNFFSNVWSWLKGDETDWKWTGLTEGFESTLREDLPKIAKRELTDAEKWLKREIDKSMGGVWEDTLDEYQRLKDLFEGKKEAETPELPTPPVTEPEPDPEKKKGEKAQAASQQFEDIMAAFNRISSAAASRTREEEIAEEALREQKGTRKAVEAWENKFEDIVGATKGIGAEIVEAIRDQSPVATFAR